MEAREIAELLGISGIDFDALEKRHSVDPMHQLKRKVRYYCFAMKRKADGENDNVVVPEQLIAYFEELPVFEGWTRFGETWDVQEAQPHVVYPRDFSIEEEWNAVLRRVVPEFPADRIWRQGDGRKGNV